jgi:hypothetical protein
MPGKKATRTVVPKAQVSKTAALKKGAPKEEKKSAKAVKSVKPPAAIGSKTVENAKKALVVAKNAKEKTVKEKAVKETPSLMATGPMAQKWTQLFKKAETIESKPYNMKASYAEKTAIVHKVLGWGYIMANRNDRLEVLFKDGIKYLISNYK